MEEKIKKMVKTGYGLGLLSLAQGKKMASMVKKELKLNEDESLKLARELVRSSEKVSKDVLKKVECHVDKALLRSKVVDKKELKIMKKLVKKRVKTLRKGKKVGVFGKLKRKVRRRK